MRQIVRLSVDMAVGGPDGALCLDRFKELLGDGHSDFTYSDKSFARVAQITNPPEPVEPSSGRSETVTDILRLGHRVADEQTIKFLLGAAAALITVLFGITIAVVVMGL